MARVTALRDWPWLSVRVTTEATMTQMVLAQAAMTLLRDETVIKAMVLLIMATVTLMLGWVDEPETAVLNETPRRTPWAEGPQIGL